MCKKADVIADALSIYTDTMYLDVDIIILDELFVDKYYQLGISPQFIRQENVNKTGYYNGGLLWTNDITVCSSWIEYTKTSRYEEQAAIEDLANKYLFFEFGPNYNLQCWRYYLGTDNVQQCLNIYDGKILYNQQPLKFVHTHFNDERFKEFNSLIIDLFKRAAQTHILNIIHSLHS